MRALVDLLILVAAAPLIAFPFAYHLATRGHWRDTVMGWHVMSFMGAFGVVMALVFINRWVVELPLWAWAVAWALVAGVAWWRLILLFVIQHRETRDE